MNTLYQVLGLISAAVIIWYLYRTIKYQPEAFSKANFSKSVATMGVLALGLIGFVWLCVLFLQAS